MFKPNHYNKQANLGGGGGGHNSAGIRCRLMVLILCRISDSSVYLQTCIDSEMV